MIERERQRVRKLKVAHAMRAIPHRAANDKGPAYQCSTCDSCAYTFEAARKHEYRMNVLHGEPILGEYWRTRGFRCIVCNEPTYGVVCNDCLGRA